MGTIDLRFVGAIFPGSSINLQLPVHSRHEAYGLGRTGHPRHRASRQSLNFRANADPGSWAGGDQPDRFDSVDGSGRDQASLTSADCAVVGLDHDGLDACS